MIATIEPTGRFESFEGVRCRIWKGKTDAGTVVEFMVPCVLALRANEQKDLERALSGIKAERELVYFDTRLL